MKLSEAKLRYTLYGLIIVAVFFFTRTYCQYDYSYAEQLRLFRYSADYALPLLTSCGGPATFLADYLTQFYGQPTVAALINTVMFLFIVFLMDVICVKILPAWISPLLSVFAGIYILVQETSLEHRMEDSLAFILILACVALLLNFRNKVVSYIIWFFFIGILHYFNLSATAMSAAGLLAILYVILSTRFNLHKVYIKSQTKRISLTIACGIAALWLGLQTFTQEHHPQSTRLKCLETMRWNKDWDGILALPYMKVCPNPLYAAYQNLALAHKGVLGEKLNEYPQQGSMGLWYENHGLQNELMLLNDIYFIQGNVAMSQMMAFNGLAYAMRHSHPKLMLRLVETNLILGAYNVAEKYIFILEQTRFYKDEATRYRQFLDHPERIDADKTLGTLKRIAQTQTGFSADMLLDLEKIVEANPDYKPAKDYLDSYAALTLNEKGK